MSDSIIIDALEYYDDNTEKYGAKFKAVKYVKFELADTNMDHNKIIMFDKTKTQIYKSRYELLGTYVSTTNTWLWGWAMPLSKKNSTVIARKIMNYGAELDPEERFLKTELITSRFRITDPIQLEIHTAVASYLAKKPLIYKFFSYDDVRFEQNQWLDVTQSYAGLTNDEYKIFYLFILDSESM